MNSLQFGLAAFSISSLALSLWAKSALRKNRLSRILFPLALIYNFSFGCFHLYFLETGRVPLIGTIDSPILAWLSLIMVFAYSYAIPWSWLSRVNFDLNRPNDNKKKLASIIPAVEQLLHLLKVTLVILASAFFYSVIAVVLLSQAIPLNGIEDTYYAIGCAALYLVLVSVGITLYKFRNRTTIRATRKRGSGHHD